MVEHAEERLLLAAAVRVERPGQEHLPVVDQRLVGPHANAALRRPVAVAARSDELVEPDRRRQLAFDEQREERRVHGRTGIEAHGSVARVVLVGAQVVEPHAGRRVPQVRGGGQLGHVLLPDGLEVLQRRDGLIRPEAAQVEIAFRRAGPIAVRELHLVERVQPPRPALRRPRLVERLDRPVLRPEPLDEAQAVGGRVRHVAVADLVVVSDGEQRGVMGVVARESVGKALHVLAIHGIADVFHVPPGRAAASRRSD